MSNDSYIHVGKSGTTIVGHDATMLYRAIVLRSSIKLYAATGMIPTRGVTITKMLAMASEYTGKRYKRGQYAEAQADLNVWIETMKSAMPVTTEES
jgi:hypothetical protein